MEKTNFYVRVKEGEENNVLGEIRNQGFQANLMIGEYDIFIAVPTNIENHVRQIINNIPAVERVVYAPSQEGALYAS